MEEENFRCCFCSPNLYAYATENPILSEDVKNLIWEIEPQLEVDKKGSKQAGTPK